MAFVVLLLRVSPGWGSEISFLRLKKKGEKTKNRGHPRYVGVLNPCYIIISGRGAKKYEASGYKTVLTAGGNRIARIAPIVHE